jgi:hypothetical protein
VYDAFLHKPYDVDHALRTLEAVLRQSETLA